MSRMLFVMFVQSMIQFGAKRGGGGEWEGYYGGKTYLHMSCYLSFNALMPYRTSLALSFSIGKQSGHEGKTKFMQTCLQST